MKRFWDKVNKIKGGCWEWTAALRPNGYGVFKYQGRAYSAHRFVILITTGDFQNELNVCHGCDNRKCVKPSHLFLGTQSDNMKDCFRKGRGVVPKPRLIRLKQRKIGPTNTAWCQHHQSFQPIKMFTKNKHRWNGLESLCRNCRIKYRQP